MNFTLIVIAALIAPAVLVVILPRRWLVRAMLFWLVLPLIVYCGIVIWETITRPPVPNLFENMAFGFMLVATIGGIPWLIASVIGFGLGFLLRRVVRPGDRAGPVATVSDPGV
ncbi:hypothetical protein [Sphingobium boeckii]|uniref:Uncharacterized protein n=1 Tax=Sphingobium boeckii TaxID=1082345 RepID=A0A7W9EET4_9SPHN|nr:hypothetical protein [Sphingobium boeckii]MBB5686507.1 hypothetical protein [Sphingobium boeckii]